MHDLLHLYARQMPDAEAVADARVQTVDRLLDYYLDSARAEAGHMRDDGRRIGHAWIPLGPDPQINATRLRCHSKPLTHAE
jgi:hypothetical protein